mgnify:CR=1 FL=1
MRHAVTAALIGSTLLLEVPAALAGTLEWKDANGRDLHVTWSSQSAEELKRILPRGSYTLSDDKADPKRLGPGGGVVLHQFNGITIEVAIASGLVEAVRVDPKGQVYRRTLFDAFAAGPSVFKKNGSTHVMVTASTALATTARGLLAAEASQQPLLQFEILIYDAASGKPAVLDQVSLAFDASTLKPALTRQQAQRHAAPPGWYAPYSAKAGTYWLTPVTYWTAGKR